MAEPIQRPSFFEGQILGARDLAEEVDYGRGQRARHERVLHEWGIADGLALSTIDRVAPDGTKFVDVMLAPGLAVDGTGREIAVPEPTLVDANLFDRLDVATGNKNDWYPVILTGVDVPLAQRSPLAALCGTLPPSRI